MKDMLGNKLFVGDILYHCESLLIIDKLINDTCFVRQYIHDQQMWIRLEYEPSTSVLVPWAIFNNELRTLYVEEAKQIKKLA